MAAAAAPFGATSFPSVASGKASVAPPKVSNAESNSRGQLEEKLPLHEDILQLARLGEVSAIRTLIKDGKFSAQHRDEQDITPLHVRPFKRF
jgi:palmitoyltransferase ZDHHC13/17